MKAQTKLILIWALAVAFLAAAPLTRAQNTPVDRIQRGGAAARIDESGNVSLEPKPAAGVVIKGSTSEPPVAPASSMRLYFNSSLKLIRVSFDGGAYFNLSAPDGLGTGTVNSVNLSAPASVFQVSGGPVVNMGTLALSFINQTPRTVFAAPVAGTGAPSFRFLDPLDIPALDTGKITTGTLPILRGGTGLTSYTFGDLLYADGTGQLARAAGNTSTTKKFLTMTGDGAFAAAPAWASIVAADVPAVNLASAGVNGGVTGTLPATNGGTGLSAYGSGNYMLGMNPAGSALQYWNFVAGSNMSISRVGSDITFSATGTLTGNFQASDGTAAAPGFSFGAETTTGLFRPATSTIGIALGGSEWARMTGTAFTFSTDNAVDLGDATHRPKRVYAGTSVDVAGSSVTLDSNGAQIPAAGRFIFNGRSRLSSASDGVLLLANNAATDFARLQFGGTSASFPALKRVGTTLAHRLADDSADAPISASDAALSGKITSIGGLSTVGGSGAPGVIARVSATSQTASIGSTTLATGLPSGEYRVSVIQINASGGTGFVAVNITWTFEGGTVTVPPAGSTNLTGGAAGIGQGTYFFRVTGGTVSYSTTYSPTGAYSFWIVLERVA